MQWVQRAAIFPSRCAVMPHIQGDHRDGFIDTRSEMLPAGKDQHVYVSVVAVTEMARLIGWQPAAVAKGLRAENDELERQNADLRAQLAEQERQLQAIDLLESAGYTRRQKPGRKPKPKIDREAVEA